MSVIIEPLPDRHVVFVLEIRRPDVVGCRAVDVVLSPGERRIAIEGSGEREGAVAVGGVAEDEPGEPLELAAPGRGVGRGGEQGEGGEEHAGCPQVGHGQ